jgi:inosine-uridine nucleoside N-ribohydrolase
MKALVAIALAGTIIGTMFSGCVAQNVLNQIGDLLNRKYESDDRIQLIIDTDVAIGNMGKDVDDGIVLFLAMGDPARINLLGITAVFGNDELANTYPKAQEVVKVAGRNDVPVFKGAASKDELGKSNEAVEFMIKTVMENPGKITLIAIGPLTNVATAMKLEPNFASSLKALFIMGGAIYQMGNQPPTMESEFNFKSDPEAAKFVMAQQCEKYLAPTDVCMDVIIKKKHIEQIGADGKNDIAQYIYTNCQDWMNINYFLWPYSTQNPDPNENGFYPWDILALARIPGLAMNDIFTKEEMLPIDVQTESENQIAPGKCVVMDEASAPKGNFIYVLIDMNPEVFINHLMNQIINYGGSGEQVSRQPGSLDYCVNI